MCKDRTYNIVLCCTSRVEQIIGMCGRLIAEHKVESMCGTAQRNAAFGAHSTQASAQHHTEKTDKHTRKHTAQKEANSITHSTTASTQASTWYDKAEMEVSQLQQRPSKRKHSTFHTFAQRGIIFSTRNARIPRPSVAAWINQSSLEGEGSV